MAIQEGRRQDRKRDRGPKGRALDDTALAEVRDLLGDRPRQRDLLIESQTRMASGGGSGSPSFTTSK